MSQIFLAFTKRLVCNRNSKG